MNNRMLEWGSVFNETYIVVIELYTSDCNAEYGVCELFLTNYNILFIRRYTKCVV